MIIVVATLCVLNIAACIAFMVNTPAGISRLEEREHMRSNPGDIVGRSGDAYMFIAERPLCDWNQWHGGERSWVKVLELLNRPAVRAAKGVGDEWSQHRIEHHKGSFKSDTWVRAWIYLTISTLQWAVIGLLIGLMIVGRSRVSSRTA